MISIRKNILIAGSFLLPVSLLSQEDTTKMVEKSLESIQVERTSMAEIVMMSYPDLSVLDITKEDIENMSADDLGELLTKLSGTVVTSYGALGGLKTISVRGLGSQHTSVIVDGFSMANAQTGQINLGQIQTEGVRSITLKNFSRSRSLDPVSTFFTGSSLLINSFMYGTRWRKEKKMNASIGYGSFNRKEALIGSEFAKNRWHVAGFARYRDSDGDYPYAITNGSSLEDGIRGNNDYLDLNVGLKLGYKTIDNNLFQFQYRGTLIDQGLPGAFILYNETADERMITSNHQFMSDYMFYTKKGEYDDITGRGRVYTSGTINNLNYQDPSYLNEMGFIDDQYQNIGVDVGYIQHYRALLWDKFRIKWGVEQGLNVLNSNRSDLGEPIRSKSYFMSGLSYDGKKVELNTDLGLQYIYDINTNQEAIEHLQFTPVVSIARRGFQNSFRWFGWFKRTFRLPTFNELYFRNVGNQDLRPEIAYQSNLGYQWMPSFARRRLNISNNVFCNLVEDKIVAIPTKNLFIWSMQNVSNVLVYGSNVNATFIKRIKDDFRVTVNANYTWQNVIDITEGSYNYGHQIAYSPEHLGNADVTVKYKGLSAGMDNNLVSSRYALNQNVSQNYLEGYWTMGAHIAYNHKLKKGNVIGVQFNAKNIMDRSYAFIRSFVMPGRHYLIKLKYEIR